VDGGVLAGRSRVEKKFFIWGGFGRDIGGTRLRYIVTKCFSGSRPIVHLVSDGPRQMDNVFPNIVLRKRDQPGKVLIQLESLILAQSERWRQA
jgi:hypothetical protein